MWRTSSSCSNVAADGIDAVFLPVSSDLEYLTGVERDLPSFGQAAYAHGWVTGAFFAPGREPVFVLPRMVVTFHLDDDPPPGTIVVNETDDASERFREAASRVGPVRRLCLVAPVTEPEAPAGGVCFVTGLVAGRGHRVRSVRTR